MPFWSDEENRHDTHWRNSPVAMRMSSTKLLALDNGELRYHAETGQIVNTHTGAISGLVSSSGVYFMKMSIGNGATHTDAKPEAITFNAAMPPAFTGQGT